jgi:hypothetical protein
MAELARNSFGAACPRSKPPAPVAQRRPVRATWLSAWVIGAIASVSLAAQSTAQVVPVEPRSDDPVRPAGPLPASDSAGEPESPPTPDEQLLAAIDAGDLGAVEQLLASGVDVERAGVFDATPIHRAAQRGDAAVLATLVRAGARLDARNVGGLTPLHMAAARGHDDAVRILVANCAPIDARDSLRRTPLHLAAERGHLEIAERLAFAGTDLRAAQPATPLRAAVSFQQADVVAMLREVDPLPAPAPEGEAAATAAGADGTGDVLADGEAFDSERRAADADPEAAAPDVALGASAAAPQSPIRVGRVPLPGPGEARRAYVSDQLASLGYSASSPRDLAAALDAFKREIGQVAPAAGSGRCLVDQLTLEVDLRQYRAARQSEEAIDGSREGFEPGAPESSAARSQPRVPRVLGGGVGESRARDSRARDGAGR